MVADIAAAVTGVRNLPSENRPYQIAASPAYLTRAIAARSFVNLKRALQPHGLGPTAWRVLASLHERDGRNIADLAEHTATDRSNLGRAIEAMAMDGFIDRRPAPRDRRNTLIFLKDKGRSQYEAVLPVVQNITAGLLANMTDEEAGLALDLLKRMLVNAQRFDPAE